MDIFLIMELVMPVLLLFKDQWMNTISTKRSIYLSTTMTLYKHQQNIVDDDPKKTLLALGTGAGKTRTALTLARGRTLVICPKTQRDDENWQREDWTMGLDSSEKTKLTHLVVMSKEEFRKGWSDDRETADYRLQHHFDTVIIDEAHTVLGVTPQTRQKKGILYPKTSRLFESLKGFLETCEPKRLYLITATIEKSPLTVWGAGVLLGKCSYDSFLQFRNIYYIKLPMPGREIYVPKSNDETKERLATFVKSLGYTGRLCDYFDVPPQTFHNEYVELTAKQKKRITEMKTEYPDPIVQIGKRLQIENGVLKGDEYNEPETFPNQKLEKLKDYGVEFPQMIVFVKYTQQIKDIKDMFIKEGKKVFVLDGSTKDRGMMFDEIKTCENYVFICQSQISAGWEIPECPVMIFASMSYSLVDRVQAEGRILRANHLKNNLFITLIAKGGVDEAVYKSITNKKDFSEVIYNKK